MKIATYFRVSTKAQGDEDRYGLAKQRNDVNKFLAKEDHEVVATFQDVGFSGATADRPGLAQLLEAENIDAVLVPALDRLARDGQLMGYLRYLLSKRGIRVISATETNGDDAMSVMMQTILAAVAGYEKDLINRRMQGGRAAKSAAGGYAYGAPRYGTAAIGKALVEVESEASTISLMQDLRAQGLTIRAIAAELNERGIVSKRGTRWVPSAVYKCLDRAA